MKNKGFTLVELLIVLGLMVFIMLFAYKLFFAQTKAVTRSIETIQVNEGFRRVLAFMGDDIREATNILHPLPVFTNELPELETKQGNVLTVQTSELNPRLRFDSMLGGQVELRRTVTYNLEKTSHTAADGKPVFKLVRFETIEERSGIKNTRRQPLADNIREFIVYRTVRRPYTLYSVDEPGDRLIRPLPLYRSGMGNNLVTVKMVLERERGKSEDGNVYNIAMETSFYKRGNEIHINP
jgi:prepilin-type N-terminal cleavage/methylation domain-containing protein